MAYAIPENVGSRGWHYLDEAERLIKADLDHPRLATMQAMWLTIWYRSTSGRRFRSNDFHEEFYRMYDELGLGRRQERPRDYDTDRKVRLYWNARSEVIWGFYCQEA